MKEIFLQTPPIVKNAEKATSETDKKTLSRWMLALFLSVIGGTVSAFAGLILGAISYLGFFRNASSVNQIGNLMVIGAFPLMMFGAHALDKINEIKHRPK